MNFRGNGDLIRRGNIFIGITITQLKGSQPLCEVQSSDDDLRAIFALLCTVVAGRCDYVEHTTKYNDITVMCVIYAKERPFCMVEC